MATAEWRKHEAEANKLQERADALFEKANDLRCPVEFRHPSNNYRDTRCVRDAGHVGVCHVEPWE